MLEDQYRNLEPLFRGLVHEIRNPVQGILATADALRCIHEENPGTKQLLEMVQQECVRINQLLTDLLDLARPVDINRAKTEPLVRVIEESIRDFQTRNPSIHLTNQMTSDLRPLHMDQACIRRAILAILQNAAESKQNDVRIRVISEDLDHQIRLRFEDNGDGISPEHLEKVIQPFFSTRPKKAGLGLSIAERIVRLHGGELQIESITEGGTAVTIRFPAAR